MKKYFLCMLLPFLDIAAQAQDMAPFTLAPAGNQLQIEQTGDYEYKLTTLGGDPYVEMSPLERDLTDDEFLVAFEYKTETDILNAEFFFSPIVGGHEQVFHIPAAQDWTTLYVDITTSRLGFEWGTAGQFLRMDQGNEADKVLYIRNIRMVGYSEILGCKDVSAISLEHDADGYYLINNAQDLTNFSKLVNKRDGEVRNARLTADIDMSEITDYLPIGTCTERQMCGQGQEITNPGFAGVFDGQGHVISNLTATYNSWMYTSGIFGNVTGTVRNLGVNNYTFNNEQAYGGRHAGIAGQLIGGVVENCYLTGSSIVHPGEIVSGIVAGNYGGIVRNCFEYGNEIEPYMRAGNIVGDNRDDNGVRIGTISNCYSEVVVAGSYDNTIVENSEDFVERNHFESGEICHKLNVNTTASSVWRQALQNDVLPNLNPASPYVIADFNGNYMNIEDASISLSATAFSSAVIGYLDNQLCEYAYADAFEQACNVASEAKNVDEFFTQYAKIYQLKDQIAVSAEAYKQYTDKVLEVKDYLATNPNFSGEGRTLVENYLETEIEPNDVFPNGSYSYILENRQLTTEQILAEAAYLQKLLDQAISSGYSEGAEVTNMLANANLANGTDGWDVKGNVGVDQSGKTPVAVANQTFTMGQTISGLTPGLYEVRVNAFYYGGGSMNTISHNSMVTANGNYIYTQMISEGALPSNSTSAYLSTLSPLQDGEGNLMGYVPTTEEQCGNLFAETYYVNTLVAEVGMDGELTVGIETPGCGKSDVTRFGNFRVFYCGEVESDVSKEAMERAIKGMENRIHTLLNNYVADGSDYVLTPNYDAALRDQLYQAIETAKVTTTGAERLAALKQISGLLQQVYATRQAYSSLLAKTELLQDLFGGLQGDGKLSDAEQKEFNTLYEEITTNYMDGKYSCEQALALNPITQYSLCPDYSTGTVTISNGVELCYFSVLVNSGLFQELNAILSKDIDMAGFTAYAPIGYSTGSQLISAGQDITYAGYQGVFDGQSHVIRNLQATYNASYASSGVFGTVSGTVKNLGVDHYTFANRSAYSGRFGAIAGQLLPDAVIDHCYVINSTVENTNEICSGIVAGNYGGTVSNCYECNNSIHPYQRAGQIVGDNADDYDVRKGIVRNCYSTGKVVGSYAGAEVTDCTGQISRARFLNGEVAYLMNGKSTENPVWFQTVGIDESPVLDATHAVVRMTEDGGYTNYDDVNYALQQKLKEARSLVTSVYNHDALIHTPSQLSSNCEWTAAGTYISYLLDGNPMTYFHSDIAYTVSSGSMYIQVALENPIDGFYLEFTGRTDGLGTGNNWHDTPNKMRIEASNDPETGWVVIDTQDYPLENVDNAHYMSEQVIELNGSFRYFRFYVLHTTSDLEYFNLQNFQMYNAASNGTSKFDEYPGVLNAIKALTTLCDNKDAKVCTQTGTKEDTEEVQAAIDVLKAWLEDPETDIQSIRTEETSREYVYDLQGRRNATPTRGIYLQGGKKILK